MKNSFCIISFIYNRKSTNTRMKRKIFTLALALATTLVANAIPAKRGIWRTMQLPNGTEVKVELRGDEFMSFWQDASGNRYTVDAQNRLRVADMDQLRQINKELRTKAGNVAGDMRRVKSNAKKMALSSSPSSQTRSSLWQTQKRSTHALLMKRVSARTVSWVAFPTTSAHRAAASSISHSTL